MSFINNIDIDGIITRLLQARSSVSSKFVKLKKSEIITLCDISKNIFLNQPMLLNLSSPINICGDIHGQFEELCHCFDLGGFPPNGNYLFLGDYVDRGKHSVEVFCLLLAYKIKFPEKFFMLRGNHECSSISKVYGFYDECKRKYNVKIWKTFTHCFDCLPAAAIVGEKLFCCHGGLSPDLTSMDKIGEIDRPADIPDSGLLCDLLWSDPNELISYWGDNDRGMSYCFGPAVVSEFVEKFDLDLIVRGHQVVKEGYQFFADRKLVTVFSAANYCYEFNNSGAVMSVDGNLVCSFHVFQSKTIRKSIK